MESAVIVCSVICWLAGSAALAGCGAHLSEPRGQRRRPQRVSHIRICQWELLADDGPAAAHNQNNGLDDNLRVM